MKSLKLGLLAVIVISTHASAQPAICGYGCSSKIIFFSDASKTTQVGSELRTCQDPYTPIIRGMETEFQEQYYGWCD